MTKKNEKCEDRSINDLNSLVNHFKTQGTPDIIDTAFEEHISTDMHNREQKLTENCTDGPICITEIKTIIKKLKKGKSSGPDLICYEIIKHSGHAMLTELAKYFNLILDTSVYPDKWNQSYIIPIFKSGDQFNPMNYRGVSLMNCLSERFNSVMNNRLLDIQRI